MIVDDLVGHNYVVWALIKNLVLAFCTLYSFFISPFYTSCCSGQDDCWWRLGLRSCWLWVSVVFGSDHRWCSWQRHSWHSFTTWSFTVCSALTGQSLRRRREQSWTWAKPDEITLARWYLIPIQMNRFLSTIILGRLAIQIWVHSLQSVSLAAEEASRTGKLRYTGVLMCSCPHPLTMVISAHF